MTRVSPSVAQRTRRSGRCCCCCPSRPVTSRPCYLLPRTLTYLRSPLLGVPHRTDDAVLYLVFVAGRPSHCRDPHRYASEAASSAPFRPVAFSDHVNNNTSLAAWPSPAMSTPKTIVFWLIEGKVTEMLSGLIRLKFPDLLKRLEEFMLYIIFVVVTQQ